MELDDDSRKDLMEAFQDLHGEVESQIISLLEQYDKEGINCLFRSIHNIKGNAGIMGLKVIVDFTHDVEEVAGALRQGRYKLSEPIAETLLLAMDRISDLHEQELYGKKFDYLRLDEFKVFYQAMAGAEAEEADSIALQTLQMLGAGIADAEIDLFSMPEAQDTQKVSWQPNECSEEKLCEDLIFFQETALHLDNQMSHWSGRSIQLFDWAMKMNKLAGTPVDEYQFAAAIYMHDIGMFLMPEELWEKKLALNHKETESLAYHPGWGHQYLRRIPGWEEAATIVLQHHERVDGSGYPNGLKSDEIHPGAKILAIVDTFFFLVNGTVDSSNRRSTVRAVSAINTRVDTEFEGLWVQCFNHVIRKELKAGKL